MKTAFITAMLLTAFIVSCALPSSLLNDNWGRSIREAKQAQILNPDAGKSVNIQEGMDGARAIEAYKKLSSSSTPATK